MIKTASNRKIRLFDNADKVRGVHAVLSTFYRAEAAGNLLLDLAKRMIRTVLLKNAQLEERPDLQYGILEIGLLIRREGILAAVNLHQQLLHGFYRVLVRLLIDAP